MRKKTIYLIRHGETEYNRKGAVQGRGINSDLNEQGRRQAAAFFMKYGEVDFDKVYVSNLIRTYQTIECFVKNGVPHEKHAGLDEISWGESEGYTIQELEQGIFDRLLEKWDSGDLDAKISQGESPNEVVARLKEAMARILGEEEEEQVLIACHGRTIRILLCHLLDEPLTNMNKFKHSNTCLYILEYDYATGQFEMKLENDTDHLELINEPFSYEECR